MCTRNNSPSITEPCRLILLSLLLMIVALCRDAKVDDENNELENSRQVNFSTAVIISL